MELGSISGYFDDVVLDVLRSDGTWSRKRLKGQIKLADDFISIFNRPTRRRMLVLSPAQFKRLNGTVVRIPDADEIFLVGNPQKDLGNGGVYRITMPMNKVTSAVDVYRKCLEGTEEDPGPLVKRLVGSFYMDLELRTLTNEGETINANIAKYFFWFQNDLELSSDDEFDFEGNTFRVLETFHDTGFRGVRATTEQDSREEVVYRQLAGASVYDNNTGQYTTSYNDFTISAEISEVMESRRDAGQLYEDLIYKVLVQDSHIGFRPTTKDVITIDSFDRDVVSITRDRHAKSWELSCR